LGTDLIRQAAVGTSQSSLFIAVGAFLFGVAFIVAFSRSVTRPLEGLTIAADKIRAGTWDTPIEVPVEAGQSVSEGDTLFVLEAMKMKTNIAAPRDGKIKAVKVAAGDTVESGQELLVFE